MSFTAATLCGLRQLKVAAFSSFSVTTVTFSNKGVTSSASPHKMQTHQLNLKISLWLLIKCMSHNSCWLKPKNTYTYA